MTEAMTAIYGALCDLMAACFKELRGSNKIDTGELRLEDGLFRAFDDIVRRQLDAVWHTVSPRTKQARVPPTSTDRPGHRPRSHRRVRCGVVLAAQVCDCAAVCKR